MIRLVLCYPVRLYLQSSVLYFLYYLPFSLVRKACCVQPFCMCTSPLQCVLLAVFRFHIHNSLQFCYLQCVLCDSHQALLYVCLFVTKCVPFCLQTRTTSGSSYTSRMWTMSLLTSSTARCQCKPSCSWTHHQTHLCSPCRLATQIPTITYTISSWETAVSIWFCPPPSSWMLLPYWICLLRSRCRRGIRRSSAAARLLRCGFVYRGRHGCLSVVR